MCLYCLKGAAPRCKRAKINHQELASTLSALMVWLPQASALRLTWWMYAGSAAIKYLWMQKRVSKGEHQHAIWLQARAKPARSKRELSVRLLRTLDLDMSSQMASYLHVLNL